MERLLPGAAAAVEDRRAGHAARRRDEHRPHESTKTVEPEVVTLCARGGFEQSVHEIGMRELSGSPQARRTAILL